MKVRYFPSRLVLFSCVCILAVASTASAQQGTVLLRCSVGFGELGARATRVGEGRLGDWTPFRIAVLNAGATVTGTLVVRVTDHNRVVSRFEKRVELPAGAQQAHEILARVGRASGPPVVAFEVDGAPVAEIEAPLTAVSSDSLRVGVVDREEIALNDISAVAVDVSDTRVPFGAGAAAVPTAPPQAPTSGPVPYNPYAQQPLQLKPHVLAPADLPRHWLGYSSFDALVLNDAPLSGLDPIQVEALRLWVANGGVLVVAGGADLAGLRRSGLDALLPVDVAERRVVTEVPGLPEVYGAFDASGGALLALGTLRDGCELLLGASASRPGGTGSAVVAERIFGAGRVRFVAIDPKTSPFRGWAGTPQLWTDLLRPAVSQVGSAQANFVYTRFGEKTNLLYDLADVRAPLVGYYFGYLLLYVLLVGPVNYALLRYKRRLEWAWVTIPAAVILFAMGTVVAARVMRGGDSILVSIGVEQYFQREGVGFRRADVLVVPAGKGSYRIDLSDGAGGFPTTDFTGGDAEPYTLDQTERASSLVASMNTWDVRNFQTLALATDEPPARVRVTVGDVEVTNASADRLRGVVAITREGIHYLGDVEPGATSRSNAPEFLQASFEAWYAGRLGDFEEGKRLVTSYASLGGGGWATAAETSSVEMLLYNRTLDRAVLADIRQPMLVAIRDGRSAAADLEEGAHERALSLVVIALEEGIR